MTDIIFTDPADGSIRIRRDELRGKIDDFLIARLAPSQQEFRTSFTHPVLSSGRFDLAIKLSYLKSLGTKQTADPQILYDAHIHAFSLGAMTEPGNERKTAGSIFRDDFSSIHHDMSKNGFDGSLSLIPLARDGTILNGAHRTACAIALGLPLRAVETSLDPVNYDYRFFKRRGMRDWQLDAAAISYIDHSQSARITLLAGKKSAIRANMKAASPLIYYKSLRLDSTSESLLQELIPWRGGNRYITLIISDTPVPPRGGTGYLSTSLEDTRALAKILLQPDRPDRESGWKRAVYALRLMREKGRHSAIKLLAKLGIMPQIRRFYRRLRS